MSLKARSVWAFLAVAILAVSARAQNHAPNPHRTVEGWAKMPAGRTWGATSAVYAARDGSGNIWVAERCGQNSCIGKEDLDTVFLFAPSGDLVKSFGAGMIVWPHGIHVDADKKALHRTNPRGSPSSSSRPRSHGAKLALSGRMLSQ